MERWKLQSAIVPVTGAASGIGLAVCRQLRAEGATPLLLDVSAERLDAASRTIYGEGPDASGHAYLVDVRNAASVDACFEKILHSHGRATHAVAAAGIVGPSTVLETTDEEWHRVIDVNLHGAMYFCRAAARQFASVRRGAIVTVASIGGLKSKENRASYTASKAALINMTRSLAVDLGPMGIRANAVAPGLIDTPIQEGNRASLDAVSQTIPLRRVGTADEIAEGVLFLLSDFASYVTGSTLVLDGGMTAKYR